MAFFSCINGYFLTGSGSSICQESGTWDQQFPTCGNEIKLNKDKDMLRLAIGV